MNTLANRSSSFSNPHERMQRAADHYSQRQHEWSQVLEKLKTSRVDIKNRRFSRDPSRTKFALQSPFEMSLIERTVSQFGYDAFGSKKLDTVGVPHLCKNLDRPRDPADFVARKNAFYQNMRNSNLHFNPTSTKNAIIFAYVPARDAERNDSQSALTAKQQQERNLKQLELNRDDSEPSI